MDAVTLRDVCIESCADTYEYYSNMQKEDVEVSRASIPIERFEIMDSYIILHADKKIPNDPSMGLSVNGTVYYDRDVNFERFDEVSRTVVTYPSEKVLKELSARDPKIILVSDMKFLIKRTQEFYKNRGDLIMYPPKAPVFNADDYKFPVKQTPSEEQKKAVHTVLNSPLSYVWGAPGTGKTQFVLATAILAYLRKGKKACIVAPTNNSLEQVLRGILKIIKDEDPKGKIVDLDHDIIRLGTATAPFFEEYPNVCERFGIDAEIRSKKSTINAVDEVLFERLCNRLKANFDEIDVLFGDEYDKAGRLAKKKIMAQVRAYFDEIAAVVSTSSKFAPLLRGVDSSNYRSRSEEIAKYLYDRPRPSENISEYDDKSDDDLRDISAKLRAELADLEKLDPKVRLLTAKIVAVTIPTFMQRLTPIRDEAQFMPDHIFVDEVGYCNVIQTLPLFAMHVPVTMLGDHMQLPPVCEMDSEMLKDSIPPDKKMRYAYMWNHSALFAEKFLDDTILNNAIAYTSEASPDFNRTAKCDLTQSRRFGDNLAKILDEHIYKNGVRGLASKALEVICVNAVCSKQIDRENVAESEAIGKFLRLNPMEPEEFVILSPYKKQISQLQKDHPNLKDNIMTVHKSQGREWDTVILSVADCGATAKDHPLRFTSTKPKSAGIKVMNTAVSRAKQRLIIVCDRKFWLAQSGEMIGDMVGSADCSL